MMAHDRIGNARINNLRRRKNAESWFAITVFAIGCVGWMAGIILVTCRIVDYYTG
jgi:hypothetical protein